ncbi:MAG TPA: HEAT repeat domain-containing protein [Phycisphaerae bacterium]|nr:HEAT repeat domain-containing protein [Phycisphaerae bacterium]HRY71353.1 HEAT repeat domain-containing protein [Phycisphaerae bacterium]HSA30098.1 HEAT repeat domain-containing protein [Phycisphaerae bacterium]
MGQRPANGSAVWLFVATAATLLLNGVPLDAASTSAGVRLRHQAKPGSLAIYDVRVEMASRPVVQPTAIAEQHRFSARLTRVLLKDRRVGMAMGVQMLELLDEPATDSRPATPSSPRTPAPGARRESSGLKNKPSPSAVAPDPPAASRPASRPVTTQPVSPLAPSPARVLLSTMVVAPRHAEYLLPAATTSMKKLMWPLVQVATWPEDPVVVGQTWERDVPWVAASCRQRVRVEKIESVKSDTRVTLLMNTTVDVKDAGASDTPLSAQTRLIWSAQDQEMISLVSEGASRQPSSEGGTLVTLRISYQRTTRRQMPPVRQTLERQAVLHLVQAIMAYQRGDADAASAAAKSCVRRWPTSYWRPLADDLVRRIDAEQQARTPLSIEELKTTLGQLLGMLNEAEANSDESLTAWCGVSFHRYTQINGPELRRLLEDRSSESRGLACLAFAFGTAPAEVGLIERHSDDPEVQVRRLCFRALALRGSPITDGQRLLAGVKDKDTVVRRWACEALGSCTTRASEAYATARATLLERLVDESSSVSLAAAKALVKVGTMADVEQIRQMAGKDSRFDVRSALIEILQAAERKAENEATPDPRTETAPAN